MRGDAIHVMHSLFLPACECCQEASWKPPADIYRTRRGWLVKFDLAGVRPEDVRLKAHGRRLEIEGTRRDWSISEDCLMYHMEIAYNHFHRQLELPCEVNEADIRQEFRDGMLFVLIPEAAASA
ncbi:MAG: Hsp20/alpha crystallin family protein [Gemmatales bacterium]|nr:Hsp20/alpha crystallin family protein [Gemmatales bacterium]MDW8386468.1 Hsp20/alpha crystallin family protein [Gemmatales bacterium]